MQLVGEELERMVNQVEKEAERSYWYNFRNMPWIMYFYIYIMLNLVWGLILFKEGILEYVQQQSDTRIYIFILHILWWGALVSTVTFIITMPKIGVNSYKRQLLLLSASFVTTLAIPITILFPAKELARTIIALWIMGPLIISLYFMYVKASKIKDLYNGKVGRDRFYIRNIYLFVGYIFFSMGIPSILLIPYGIIARDPDVIIAILISIVSVIGVRMCYRYQNLSEDKY